MKIAILGTRGIPNKYGGFEQFAEYLSVGLVEKGHAVTVYNPKFHDYQDSTFKGVEIIHVKSPEDKLGAAANFIFDYLCLKDALKKDFDIILECGYQSASISYFFTPIHKSKIVTNMDGLEWKRAKWSKPVKALTKLFEKWGVKKSHHLVSDNEGIRTYFKKQYGVESSMIPYGANLFSNPDTECLTEYNVQANAYYLVIARLEPENNIEPVLDGYTESTSSTPFLVVGNHETDYGRYLKQKYEHTEIQFLGGIYNADTINNLRYFSKAYFHGHSVGGTNPSLLEAMACSCLIVAHDNPFNKSVLGENARYFGDKKEVAKIIDNLPSLQQKKSDFVRQNLKLIETTYSWTTIVNQYEALFLKLTDK